LIQLPHITGKTPDEKISQLISYIRVMAEELQRLQLKVEEEKK
jgi:hypothetical protein